MHGSLLLKGMSSFVDLQNDWESSVGMGESRRHAKADRRVTVIADETRSREWFGKD